MQLHMLIEPESLVQIRERDAQILMAAIKQELLANPAIREQFASVLQPYVGPMNLRLKDRPSA